MSSTSAKSPPQGDEEHVEYDVAPVQPALAKADSPEPTEDINDTWWRHFREQTALERSFSISDMLLMTTLAACVVAVGRLLPAPLSAAVLGLIVMAGLAMLLGDAPRPRLFLLGWWTLLALYLVFSAVAVVGS